MVLFRPFRVIVCGKSMEIISSKDPRTILLRLGLITSQFAYWENPKAAIFMISRFWDVSLAHKTKYFIFGNPKLP